MAAKVVSQTGPRRRLGRPPGHPPTVQSTDVSFVDSGFSSDFLQNLRRLQQSDLLTDVAFKAGDVLLPCHRVVLAAASPYFTAMFTSGFGESASPTVEMKCVDHETLKTVIDYMYTAEVKLTSKNVQNLAQASNEYQLGRLKTACEKFMLQQLNHSNCIGFYRFAKLFDLETLREESRNEMLTNLQSVSATELKALTETELIEYITDSDLAVSSEDVVFAAVTSWVDADRPGRSEAFERVLPHVQLRHCTPPFLSEVVENEPLMTSAPICKQLLQAAKKHHSTPEVPEETARNSKKQPEETASEGTTPRKCFSRKHRLVLVGGFTKMNCRDDFEDTYRELTMCEEDENKKCWYFEEESRAWRLLTELPWSKKIISRRFYSICAMPDGLLLTGGDGGKYSLNNKDCWLFDLKENKWQAMPDMTDARRKHASVVHRGDVYVIGGEVEDMEYIDSDDRRFNPTDSVEVLDKQTKQWRKVEPMKKALAEPLAVGFGHSIYVFGGTGSGPIISKGDTDNYTTQVYDTVWGKWSFKAKMPTVGHDGSAVAVNNRIYLIGGFDWESASYNPATDTWVTLNEPDMRHGYAPAVAWEGKVLVGGGCDGDCWYIGTQTIEQYDPKSKKWSKWHTGLPVGLQSHFLFDMDLPMLSSE